jgi:hypothetical protein
VPQAVRRHRPEDAGTLGEPAHDPGGGVTVQPSARSVVQDRPVEAFADRSVGAWHQRQQRRLLALADDAQGAMSTGVAEVADVGIAGLGHTQGGERQQTCQRMVAAAGEAGFNEERAELRAV